jgi:chromosome segregation ATPase
MSNPAILEQHHKAIEHSVVISKHTKKIEALDEKVREQLEQRETHSAEVRRIQTQWKKLIEQFARMLDRVSGGKQLIKETSEKLGRLREQTQSWLGNPGTANTEALKIGARICLEEEVVEKLFKPALAQAERELAEHRAKMAEFGREHGIDADILKELEG